MTTGLPGAKPETGRRPNWATFFIAFGLAIFGAILLFDAVSLRAAGGYSGVGPAAMPKLVGGVLIVLALFTAISGRNRPADMRPSQRLWPVAWLIAGLTAQIIMLQPLGFSIATTVLFACGAAAFGERRFHISVPGGFILTLAVYGIFDQLLRLNLPAGLPERLLYGG